MMTLTYLLAALGAMMVLYALYRAVFFSKRKPPSSSHPHFTLKIETD